MSEKPSLQSTSKKSGKSGKKNRAAKHGNATPKLSVAEAKSDRKKR